MESYSRSHDESIPRELRDRAQWVCWRAETRGNKPTKIPYGTDGKCAKSNDPSTWDTFEAAAECSWSYSGIGFVFSQSDPYCGIDLDGCRDSETGTVQPWAREIIERFNSYCEVSPSETGVKIFCRGKWRNTSKHEVKLNVPKTTEKDPAIEGYDQCRYFATTGKIVDGLNELRDAQDAIDWLTQKYFEAPRTDNKWKLKTDDEAEKLADALRHVSAEDYGQWVNVGMALHSWNRTDGLRLWDDWSATSGKYAPGDCARKWQSFNGSGLTIATIFKLAIERGWKHTPKRITPTAQTETPDKPRFKPPVPISQLVRPARQQWLWDGFLKLGGILLLSALWKAGKTTLLSRLILALARGGQFLGLPIECASILYITEENDGEWVERRDKLGIGDHVHVLSQPWNRKPTMQDWFDWFDFLAGYCVEHSIGLVVFDTVSTVWPIKNENDASEVNEALMPMRRLADGRSVCVVHHLVKIDRRDGTATRGSGALAAFVDTITELRRYGNQSEDGENLDHEDDRRRVLTSFSRWDETPRKLVIRLRDDGLDFDAEGDGQEVKDRRLIAELLKLLPTNEPGITVDEAHKSLPDAAKPRRAKVVQTLQSGAAAGQWQASGTGVRGDPRRFWKP